MTHPNHHSLSKNTVHFSTQPIKKKQKTIQVPVKSRLVQNMRFIHTSGRREPVSETRSSAVLSARNQHDKDMQCAKEMDEGAEVRRKELDVYLGYVMG